MSVLNFKKLSLYATTPQRAHENDAGLDLFSAVDATLEPWSRSLIATDIAVAIPEGTYGRIAPRSGLALKKCIDVAAGVIDVGYRGNVGVILVNNSHDSFKVNRGDKIAQLIIEKILMLQPKELDELPSLGNRGQDGFGSSGFVRIPTKILTSDNLKTKRL